MTAASAGADGQAAKGGRVAGALDPSADGTGWGEDGRAAKGRRLAGLPPLPFAGRRESALAALKGGAMVLPASPLRFKNADSEYRYRPDSELFYLTGWKAPGCVAVLRGFADRRRFVLFVEGRDEEKKLWTGPRAELGAVEAECGADAVFALEELPARAPELLRGADLAYYRFGASEACDRVVLAGLQDGRRRRPRTGRGLVGVLDPGLILDDLRLRKDEAETARLREAARITTAAFREGLAVVRPGAGEWEVEAAVEAGFRRRGADGPAFATIAASGANACTLHYTANDSRIGPGEMVLVDAGAEVECCAADVSRTAPASRRIEGAAREAYEVVLGARRAALAACRPGAALQEVHEAAARAVAEGLVALGVLRGTPAEAVETGAYRRWFPHQTSHWLGLDVHDVGAYRAGRRPGPAPTAEASQLRSAASELGAPEPVALSPGMAFTVEPGVYFSPGSCARVPELEGIGIRIEDDVLIEEDGADVLTSDLPVDAEAIEEMAAG